MDTLLPQFSCLSCVSWAADRPNVLFIASADMRPQLGCCSDTMVNSPNLEALAKRGMVFKNSCVQQAQCSPPRISMLSWRGMGLGGSDAAGYAAWPSRNQVPSQPLPLMSMPPRSRKRTRSRDRGQMASLGRMLFASPLDSMLVAVSTAPPTDS